MTFLFAAIGPYIPNGGEAFGAAVAFTFLLVIGIASIRKIKKNKKKETLMTSLMMKLKIVKTIIQKR